MKTELPNLLIGMLRVLVLCCSVGICAPLLQAQETYSNYEARETALPAEQGGYAPGFLQPGAANTPAAIEPFDGATYVERASYSEAIRNEDFGPGEFRAGEFRNGEFDNNAINETLPAIKIAPQQPDSQLPIARQRGPQHPSESAASEPIVDFLADQADKLTDREGAGSSIKIALLLTALSLAPAVVLMTTCYVRVVVVLSLLRQAFGAQQLPPTQVLTALSLFITILVMAPVWNEIKKEAIDPYANSQEIDWQEAWDRGVVPVRSFMSRQIEAAGNGDTVAMLYKYAPSPDGQVPQNYNDVPLTVLLPSFMISELKVAFLLGFQIYLPFLIVDLVVSSVTVSMGMLMLPPTMVSFPMKLILFVMVDGWALVVGMLLQSFAPYT